MALPANARSASGGFNFDVDGRLYTIQDSAPASDTTAAVVTQTSSGVSVTTSDTSVLAANATRKGVQIVNTGTAGVTLTLGATATAKQGIWVGPNGGSWDGLLGRTLWTGSIRGISDSGTNVVSVVEV